MIVPCFLSCFLCVYDWWTLTWWHVEEVWITLNLKIFVSGLCVQIWLCHHPEKNFKLHTLNFQSASVLYRYVSSSSSMHLCLQHNLCSTHTVDTSCSTCDISNHTLTLLSCSRRPPSPSFSLSLSSSQLQPWVGGGFRSKIWARWTVRAGFFAGRTAAASWEADGRDTGSSWRGVLCTGTPTRRWVTARLQSSTTPLGGREIQHSAPLTCFYSAPTTSIQLSTHFFNTSPDLSRKNKHRREKNSTHDNMYSYTGHSCGSSTVFPTCGWPR